MSCSARRGVKDTGRKTARGAPIWRAADGHCPDGHLTPGAARDRLADLLAAERAKPRAKSRAGSARTLGDATDTWLEHVATVGGRRGREIAPTTLRGYRSSASVIGRVIAPETPLRKVDAAACNQLQRKLLARELQRWTVRHHMITLRAILAHAASLGWLSSTPFSDGTVSIIGQPPPPADFNVLEPSEVEAVARAVEAITDAELPRYRASDKTDERALALMRATRATAADAVRLAAYTGLRVGELRALRWRDVDLLGEVLLVRRNAPASAPAAAGVKAPKSTKARSVPIMDQAATVLARVKDQRENAGLPTGPDDLVLSTTADGMIQSGKLRDAFYRGLLAAGFGHLREKPENPMTVHDLRHTFGTIAVRAFDLVEVQAYMGHSDIGTTMRYVHHVPRHDAARRLSAAFAEDRGAPGGRRTDRVETTSGTTERQRPA
ncbi:tyrosine-type recombinase/integrase [Paraconexibacter sp.]|uniref:tyrosine-type recombinase/integrase n=1 Tax=Paraconexibacter sp. TaxID=2949640 RepID=UPI003565762D